MSINTSLFPGEMKGTVHQATGPVITASLEGRAATHPAGSAISKDLGLLLWRGTMPGAYFVKRDAQPEQTAVASESGRRTKNPPRESHLDILSTALHRCDKATEISSLTAGWGWGLWFWSFYKTCLWKREPVSATRLGRPSWPWPHTTAEWSVLLVLKTHICSTATSDTSGDGTLAFAVSLGRSTR